MIHAKICLINQGCPRPVIALQGRIVAENTMHFIDFSLWKECVSYILIYAKTYSFLLNTICLISYFNMFVLICLLRTPDENVMSYVNGLLDWP